MRRETLAGIGWRAPHHGAVLEQHPEIGFLEVHAENHMGGGRRIAVLEQARRDYPISIHGVGLSLGSVGPVDAVHLDRFAALVAAIDPVLVSEHVAWCRQDGIYLNDLLPLPYTEEALAVLVRNIDRVQARLKRPILMENPSTYLAFAHAPIPEGAFLAEMARRSGCGLLLDVNNLYVNERNHGLPARAVLAALDPGSVAEIHVAGHHVAALGDAVLLIDDHGASVSDAVWDLYRDAVALFPQAKTLVEWTAGFPRSTSCCRKRQRRMRIAQWCRSCAVLAELQHDFARALRGDALAVPRIGIDAAGLNAERRVAVYRNHHRISLAAALAANFPTVVKVIGEQAFEALALSYLAFDPPRDACLAAYGGGFPAFLESDPRAQGLVYLGDVAWLDWAQNVAERAEISFPSPPPIWRSWIPHGSKPCA